MKPCNALLSLVLVTALPVAAQSPPGGGAPAPANLPSIGTLEFGGGSLTELVELIRQAHREPLNIVLDPDAEAVTLPALTLRNVSVSGALKVAQSAARGGARVSVQRVREEPGDQEVFVIRIESPGKSPRATSRGEAGVETASGGFSSTAGPLRPRRLEVISLSEVLAAKGGKDVDATLRTTLTAIEEALLLGGKEEEVPTFKVHGESGLLFVRGSDEQILVVQKVVQEMSLAGSAAEASPRTTIAQLRTEVERLRIELEARTRAYDELLAKLRAEKADGESKPVPRAPVR